MKFKILISAILLFNVGIYAQTKETKPENKWAMFHLELNTEKDVWEFWKINLSKIQKVNSYLEFWIRKIDVPTLELDKYNKEKDDYIPPSFNLVQYKADCVGRKMTITYFSTYQKDKSPNGDVVNDPLKPVIPDTLGEKIFEQACKLGKSL